MHRSSPLVVPGLTLALLAFSGCGINTPITGPAATSSQTRIGGTLHGGQQPIAFSTIQLWAAGSTGYGSQGQLFATTQSADDGAGSFNFLKQPNTDTPYPSGSNTWACPASSDPYMYLVATGGNTQGSHLSSAQNSAVGFLLAIGKCSAISQSSFYFLNEVTTAGSLAALTQFFSPVTETIGAPASTLAQQGLANAFALVPTLIDISSGVPQSTKPANVSVIVDAAKLNTLGNITAACINSALPSSPTCSILFANAAPPSPLVTSQPTSSFPAATDTLQALWYMFANPADGSTTRLANLYGVIAPNPPFQPALTSQPTDWIVTLTVSSSLTPFTNNSFQIPVQIAISGTGLATFALDSYGIGGFLRLMPSGENNFSYSAGVAATSVAYDKRTNLWVSSQEPVGYTTYLYDFMFSANGAYPNFAYWQTNESQYVITGLPDGDFAWASRAGSLYFIASASVDAVQQAGGYQAPTTSALKTTLPAQIKSMVADSSGNLWAACANGNLYELTAVSNYTPVVAASIGTDFIDNISALAVDASGAVLLPTHPTAGTPQVLRVSGSPSSGYTTSTLPGTASALAIAVDGAGNIWQAPSATETLNGVVSGFITAMTSTGTSLLGASGIARPATSTTLVQNFPVLGPAAGMAIDLAGDVWVSNTGTNLFNTTDGPQYSVTELVGAAVPVTPPSVGLFNNTLAQKP